MKFIKKVGPGEMLPAWYGIAWRNWLDNSATCLPVGFNLVAAMLLGMWIFIRHGGRALPMEQRAAYDQGRRDERALWTMVQGGYQPFDRMPAGLKRYKPGEPGYIARVDN